MKEFATQNEIPRETLDLWSKPYRNWHYYPEYVISDNPQITGFEDFKNTDVPCVYQIPEKPDVWLMSFIGFNGLGYNSFIAESADLLHWHNFRPAMGFGKPGEFDFGGCVMGAYLYESYDIRAPRMLKRYQNRYWTLYSCYPKQGGYEIDPGYEGIAASSDGVNWTRASDRPVLSVFDEDAGTWEKDCIYMPWLVEEGGKFYNFYNAKEMPMWIEQLGRAESDDLLHWRRSPGNPVLRVKADTAYARFCSDGKVFRDGDHWVIFFFGVNERGAHILAAFSRDLANWTIHPEPLYSPGGHPAGLDECHAHKISLVWNPVNGTFYMYYCAANKKGRGIALLTDKPVVG